MWTRGWPRRRRMPRAPEPSAAVASASFTHFLKTMRDLCRAELERARRARRDGAPGRGAAQRVDQRDDDQPLRGDERARQAAERAGAGAESGEAEPGGGGDGEERPGPAARRERAEGDEGAGERRRTEQPQELVRPEREPERVGDRREGPGRARDELEVAGERAHAAAALDLGRGGAGALDDAGVAGDDDAGAPARDRERRVEIVEEDAGGHPREQRAAAGPERAGDADRRARRGLPAAQRVVEAAVDRAGAAGGVLDLAADRADLRIGERCDQTRQRAVDERLAGVGEDQDLVSRPARRRVQRLRLAARVGERDEAGAGGGGDEGGGVARAVVDDEDLEPLGGDAAALEALQLGGERLLLVARHDDDADLGREPGPGRDRAREEAGAQPRRQRVADPGPAEHGGGDEEEGDHGQASLELGALMRTSSSSSMRKLISSSSSMNEAGRSAKSGVERGAGVLRGAAAAGGIGGGTDGRRAGGTGGGRTGGAVGWRSAATLLSEPSANGRGRAIGGGGAAARPRQSARPSRRRTRARKPSAEAAAATEARTSRASPGRAAA